MYGIHSVTCTRCLGVIQLPGIGATAWCTCGKTYLNHEEQSVGWGGPGEPRTNEPDTFPDDKPASKR